MRSPGSYYPPPLVLLNHEGGEKVMRLLAEHDAKRGAQPLRHASERVVPAEPSRRLARRHLLQRRAGPGAHLRRGEEDLGAKAGAQRKERAPAVGLDEPVLQRVHAARLLPEARDQRVDG